MIRRYVLPSLVAVLGLTCDDLPFAPGLAVESSFDLREMMALSESIPIPTDSVVVELRRTADSSVAFREAFDADSLEGVAGEDADSVVVEFTVTLSTNPESFYLHAYSVGEDLVWFEVRDEIIVEVGGADDNTIQVIPQYIGIGADGTAVTMSLSDTTITGGDSVLVTGTVFEGEVEAVGAPVGFTSSDPGLVFDPDPVGRNQAWLHAPIAPTGEVTITALALNRSGFLTTAGTLRFYARPNSLELVSGNNQQVNIGSTAMAPLVVLVRDAGGNPFDRGYEVVFEVVSGPAGTVVTDDTVTTDANGLAQTSVIAGDAEGVFTVRATAEGLSGSPITFDGTVFDGGGPQVPAEVVIVSGDGQSADAGTALANPLVVEVRDEAGAPVPNVDVEWSAVQGAVNPMSTQTDAAGRAQTNWTLGTNAVDQTAAATVTGLPSVVFSATAVFPNPTILMNLVGADRISVGGTADLEVTLTAPAVGPVTVDVTSDNPAVLAVQSPGSVTIPDGAFTGQITLDGVAGGNTTVRANAANYSEGTLAVDVSLEIIGLPATLNVPFGQMVSLPIQISTPAPVGGETVTLISNDPGIVEVLTPTVVIPEGLQTANGTVLGASPGSATITATSAMYGSAQSDVATTANLDFAQTSARLNASFSTDVTVRFESQGSGIPAPSPGIQVTLTAADPSCVAATSPLTIETGLVDVTSTLSYGGGATLPCTTDLTATAPDVDPATISVTVDPVPAISMFDDFVGSGLQDVRSIGLGASNHGGVTVTITSNDDTAVLVSPDPTTPGQASITIDVLPGVSNLFYYFQGVEGIQSTTAATVTASAPGFTDGSATVTVDPAALVLQGLATSTTTLTVDDAFYVQVGRPNAEQTFMAEFQSVRAGIPGGALTATVVSGSPAVGQLVTTGGSGATQVVQIAAGQSVSPTSVSNGGVALEPLTEGTTTVSATIPGLVALPGASVDVSVTQPVITMPDEFVGSGLQDARNFNLGATDHGGVTLTISSDDDTAVLVSPNATTPGQASITIDVPDGTSNVTYFFQGVEGIVSTATANVTASAPGFTAGTGTVTVDPAALVLQGLATSTTTLSVDDAFYVQVGRPNAAQTFMAEFQSVRAGIPGGALTATVVSGSPAVGQLVTTGGSGATQVVQIAAGQSVSPTSVSNGGVALEPLTEGTTTVSATIPGLVALPGASVDVTVTQPAISVTNDFVGSGLQDVRTANLGATDHGGVTVTVASDDDTSVLVSRDATTPGQASITIDVPDGTSGFNFYFQGVEGILSTATANVTLSAPGFAQGTAVITVEPAALVIQGLITTTTTLSADDPFYVQVGRPNAGQTFMAEFQNVRAGIPGGALTATVVSGTPSVGQLVTSSGAADTRTVQIPEGRSVSPTTVAAGGVAFRPILNGTSTVSATIPDLVALPGASVDVTVSQPVITVQNDFVGSGLQDPATIFLGAPDHGDMTVTVTSSNSGVLLVAPDATTPGQPSIDIPVADGVTNVAYYIQGVEGRTVSATATVTVTAPGFTDGTATITVDQSALLIQQLNANTNTSAGDDPFYVQVGRPNAQQTFMAQFQNVRAGIPGGALSVDVTSATPSVGELVTSAGAAATRTVLIPEGQSLSPTSVANGGVAFRPQAEGTTSVSAAIPAFIVLPGGTIVVTVTP